MTSANSRQSILECDATRKRCVWVILTVALAALAVVALIRFSAPPEEPLYASKRLSEYLPQLLNADATDPNCEEAVHAIRSLGKDAMPYLISVLDERESKLKRLLLEGAEKVRWIKPRSETPLRDRQRLAAKGCEILGPVARPAIPALSIHLRSDQGILVMCAASALGAIGPEAIPALTNALLSTNVMTRSTSVLVLGRFAESDTLFPTVIRTLNDSDARVRSSAILALARFRQRPGLVVTALLACLSDSNAQVRLNSVSSLAQFDGQSSNAVSAFIQLLADPAPAVRLAAAVNLRKIGPPRASSAEIALRNSLNDEDQLVRQRAKEALDVLASDFAPTKVH